MTFDLGIRRSGIVLHLTSLPGPHGVGDLGADARRFVDWLADCGQSLWQVLPFHPVGPGHSPYQCPSAFAGCPWMVALPPLVRAGWLDAAALDDVPAFDPLRADYERAIPWRWARLQRAAAGFFARARPAERRRFEAWCEAERGWLDEWTLYAALKDAHGGGPWWAWGEALARRDAAALRRAHARHAGQRRVHAFVQWQFDEQLQSLREHARERGVALMGDVPIFVAHDSADVWSRPDLYFMDERHALTVVAGVPPDGFGPDGQRWGNPLYRWDRMAAEGYGWWVARLERALAQADLVRIDHFRGFAGYWEVPAACPTAREGRWAPGPGAPLFEAFRAALGESLPIVAEDLGTITPDVIALRDGFGLPGMRIVQEGFGGWGDGSPAACAGHPFLPHHHVAHALAYSSTHDSDTARGWWDAAPPATRAFAAEYLACDDAERIHWALIRATSQSVARLALFPLQDVLGLDSAHRMNRPGTADGNWRWRFDWPMLGSDTATWLARITTAAGRAR
ncbi:MAG: 4-alpha-glucanotransferase [Pseudomonadota bacterium]|jgi:4-alpha-glucanotransferase|nr:4-alpha-glucanotransferase [Rubrivivax sp.]MCA3256503.1 4-alpha-glucanotransferase [Rubrivivax sp.]MCE2910506.1 4-alpha-glucanotransferase [Rubrivivax sp.]MCZ8029247.1 4-alpha-glucanotransferase [Rubrivivax sp.]